MGSVEFEGRLTWERSFESLSLKLAFGKPVYGWFYQKPSWGVTPFGQGSALHTLGTVVLPIKGGPTVSLEVLQVYVMGFVSETVIPVHCSLNQEGVSSSS